jgi:hypothetical protein
LLFGRVFQLELLFAAEADAALTGEDHTAKQISPKAVKNEGSDAI